MKHLYIQVNAGMFYAGDMPYLTLQVAGGPGITFPLKCVNDAYNYAASRQINICVCWNRNPYHTILCERCNI